MPEKHIHYQEHCKGCAKQITKCPCYTPFRVVRMNTMCPACMLTANYVPIKPMLSVPNYDDLNDAVYEECEDDEKDH